MSFCKICALVSIFVNACVCGTQLHKKGVLIRGHLTNVKCTQMSSNNKANSHTRQAMTGQRENIAGGLGRVCTFLFVAMLV